jgi:hypothetical protein
MASGLAGPTSADIEIWIVDALTLAVKAFNSSSAISMIRHACSEPA